ncbi:hypothetical protein C8R44DRAFT_885768 [Mycena epipterygia]|nr:hypothetical protein C8R44DRAFT_885768 [Mycena epipterygia]
MLKRFLHNRSHQFAKYSRSRTTSEPDPPKEFSVTPDNERPRTLSATDTTHAGAKAERESFDNISQIGIHVPSTPSLTEDTPPARASTHNAYLLAPGISQFSGITQSTPASPTSSFVEESPYDLPPTSSSVEETSNDLPLAVPYEMIDMEDCARYRHPTSQEFQDFGHIKSRFVAPAVEPVMTDIYEKPGHPRKVIMVSSPTNPLKLGQRLWVHGTLQGVWEITAVRYRQAGIVGLHWTNHDTREIAPVIVAKKHVILVIHKPEGRTRKVLRTISMPFMNLIANRSRVQLEATPEHTLLQVTQ